MCAAEEHIIELEAAIASLEAHRTALGDAVVEAALAPLRQRLAALQKAEAPSPSLEGERRLVTIMFADISGFTPLCEKMDPETVRDLMNACFGHLVPVIKKYDGTVDKFIGDEIMALFGAPVAHENDPERAVCAALDMQAALTAFNAERGTDLGIHFGINTGLVLAGSVGAAGRQDYSVTGDAVNLAKRLEDASERGQIFVGPDTYRLTASLFEFKALEPLKLKGKAEPVPVYCVQGAKALASCQRRGLTAYGLQSPLVGRVKEVAALNACLARLMNGQGGIIGIIGEAGLGKSRLLAEVRATGQSPYLWLEGHTLSFGQSISYWPFQEILRGYAGITEDDSEAEAWYKLERKVAALFPDTTAEILPYLGSLLTLNVPEKHQARVKYLDGEGLGKQIFLASWRFWEHLARRQPVVLVFEDLHWMDESSFRLVEHLLPLVRKVPLLVIGLSRPSRETTAARLREKLLAEYGDEYTDLRLEPLSPPDSAQLVHNVLAIENITAQTREMIVRKAEGNPFFLEEVIRMLIETGAVERDARTGQWRWTAQMDTLTIPDTVQGVIMARVDRLDEQVKQVLRLASVIGRSFLYCVLRALDQADQELDQNLAELQAVEMIREKQATPELEYIFRHALAQEATYESILLQKRRELHAQVGAAIEALFTDRLEEFYGLLAYHYAKAEAWEKAHEYLLKAADQAGQMAADAEALNHYRQAMAAYNRAFGDKWEPLQRAQLERKMGEALFRRGEHTQAFEYLERGMALLGHRIPASRRQVRLAIVRAVLRQAGHRLLPGLLLRKVGRPTPALEEFARLALAAGWIFTVTDRELLLWVGLYALNVSEQHGLDHFAALTFSVIGYSCDLMGFFWLSKHFHRLGTALAERIQYPGAITMAYQVLTNHQLYLGNLGSTLDYGPRCANICLEVGDLRTWGAVSDHVVVAFVYRGDLSRALEYSRERVRLGQEGGDRQIVGWALTTQGFVERRMGHLDEACAHLRQAIELLDAVPDYLVGENARGELGRCYLQQGQLSQALAVLEKCPNVIKEKGLKGLHITQARNGLAEAYLVAAEQAGQKEKGEWLRKTGRACRAALRQGKILRPGLPEAMRLRGRYEWLRGRHSQARQWWQRSLRETEAMGLRYDEGMAYLEMGQRLGERTHLERAVAILAEIGAEYDLLQAQGALGHLAGEAEAMEEQIIELEAAIASLEAHRTALGDAVVEVALAPLRQKLAALRNAEAPRPSLEGERRLVTIMFADISGFTPLSEKMDPEAVRDLMNACFECLVPVIRQYGGTIDKFMGDEIMALFGAPLAHENDAERALRAALEMLGALVGFNAEHNTALGMHLGINTGLVLAGGIGSSGQQGYSVMGDTVNVAARLEDASARGQVWVGADTYRLTAPLFAFEPLPPVSVKGKAEPVTAYRLIGVRSAAGSVRGLGRQGLSSPLVGREAELAVMRGCLERLLAGQGGIVTLTGDAGLGKSRLVAELRRPYETGPAPLVWLEGRTLSFGQTISYWPFQEILRRYAGIDEDDAEAEAWRKLEQRLAALFPDTLAEILPYLGSLLSLVVPEAYQTRVKYLDGEALGKQIFMASRRFFAQLASRQPLVLVFEDLHWMDESSFSLLEHLLPLVPSAPLLVIAVSRLGQDTPGARLRDLARREYPDSYTGLPLAPLSAADGAQLVHNLLDIEDLSARTRDLIVSKAEGNPFFIEEVIRTLIETGAVVRDAGSGRWRATALSESFTIPDTIQGVIMARVDRLDEQVKQVLRLASVIGRSFLYRVLRALDEANRELDQHLESLQAVELIREKQAAPEVEYIFRHALAQEATYASILLQKRRDLHARVGQAIETLFADRLEEFYSLLAYHYARAEAWEPAQAYLFKAGDQAGRMAADAEALTHYQQAIAAYTRVFGDRWDPLQRAAVERKMGEALFRRGEHTQALEYLERGMALLGYPVPTSRRAVRLAIGREVLRQAGHRLLPGLFLRQAGKPTPALEELARLEAPLGWIWSMADQERYLWVVLSGLNVAELNGLDDHAVSASGALGFACDLMGLFRLGGRYHRLAVSLAERIQHPLAIGLAYLVLMQYQLALGDIDAALESGRKSAQIYRQTGESHAWGSATGNTANCLIYRGDLLAARELGQEIVRLWQQVGDRQVVGWGLDMQSFAEERLGRLDEACVHIRQAIELLDAVPDHLISTSARGELGRCYLRQGQLAQALATLEECQALCAKHNSRGWCADTPRNALAEAYLVAAEQAGQKEKSEWLQKAGRACRDALKQGKIFRPGLPEAMRLQGRHEWLRGRHPQARQWWQRSLRETEAMGLRYDEGMAHLEMGKRLGERTHLEKAAEIFAAIGAEYDLAKARGALEHIRGG